MRRYPWIVLAAVAIVGVASCNKPAEDTSSQPAVSATNNVVADAGQPAGTIAASAETATPGGAATCAGCGKAESDCTCADCKDEHGEAGHGHEPGKTDLEHSDGSGTVTEIKLADGSVVPVVTVAALNADPKGYQGKFAIDGAVGEVFADKGRFMLVDCGAGHCQDKGCKGCADDQQVPVRVDLAKAKGKLPPTAQRVLVVADITPSAAGGFTLAVHEVRAGDNVLLTVAS